MSPADAGKVAVVTLASANRCAHVAHQLRALREFAPASEHICVALGDGAPALREALRTSSIVDLGRAGDTTSDLGHRPGAPGAVATGVPPGDAAARRTEGVRDGVGRTTIAPPPQHAPVPLAAARNAAGDEALRRVGADGAIVFLDADCLPGPELVHRYAQCVREHQGAVLAGPVTYLTEQETRRVHGQLRRVGLRPDAGSTAALREVLRDVTHPHPARPAPPPRSMRAAEREEYDLFWSLSFALSGRTWASLRDAWGGFDEGFRGYGGEDTDFGWRLRDAGVPLVWTGGAHAYHQFHPVSSPPWEHLRDIVENANRLYRRWGRWAMEGWLREFEDAGAVAREGADGEHPEGQRLVPGPRWSEATGRRRP